MFVGEVSMRKDCQDLRKALGFDVEGKRKKEMWRRTWKKKQVDEVNMKVDGLRKEDALSIAVDPTTIIDFYLTSVWSDMYTSGTVVNVTTCRTSFSCTFYQNSPVRKVALSWNTCVTSANFGCSRIFACMD